MTSWTIYLEWKSRADAKAVRSLINKQFWAKPYENRQIVLSVTFVHPKGAKLSLVSAGRNIVKFCCGVLFQDMAQITEFFCTSKHSKGDELTPRIILRMWVE